MFDEQNQPVDIFAEVDKSGPSTAVPQQAVIGGNGVERHGPSRLLLVAIILVVLGLGGGGYYLFVVKKAPVQVITNDISNVPAQPDVNGDLNSPQPTDVNVNAAANVPPITPEPQPNEPVQPPDVVQAPPDADADGLSDEEEAVLGTNPQATDTDTDGLSDRDEAKLWMTNPQNPDTDGDTFTDGEEVRGGYNPNGPGKLFGAPQ